MPIIRKKLAASDFSNANLRYNDSCDCIEFTPDGGETWIPDPSNDPRTSIIYQLPPLTGDDVRCRAAEGMTLLIKGMVDKRLEDIDAVGLAGWILGFVAFIPGFNVLYALILAFAGAAVAIAGEILEAAFTDETYDEIRCIFYCVLNEQGQMTQAGFDAAYANLITLNAVARSWVQEVMNFMGFVGMNDAGVSLAAIADCSDCFGGCCEFPITFDPGTEGCYTLTALAASYAITTLDSAFGNAAPSAKSGIRTASGYTGFAARVVVPVYKVISQATAQIYYTSTGNPSNVLYRSITLFDEDDVILAQYSVATAGFTPGTWNTITVNYAGASVCKEIQVACGVEGTGINGTAWVDNIDITEVP